MANDQIKNSELPEKRKASDILLALEDRVITLTKVVSSYDMNMKLLLDRVNYIFNYIKQVEAADQTVASPPPELPIQTSQDSVITVAQEQVGVRRTARSESYSATPPPRPQDLIMQRTQSEHQPINSDKKVPVIQRITDHTGKDLFMAEVSIMNDKKEVISKLKTNAAGKWQAHLKPGKYNVSIVKTDTASKKKIEATQEINVINSNTMLTLPTAIIKR